MAIQLVAPVRQRRARGVLLVALAVVVMATVFVSGDKPLSDGAGRVTVTVPRLWSDTTRPEAGQWVSGDTVDYKVPDLRAGNLVHERSVAVTIEPRVRGLVELHQAEVTKFCTFRACVDRGQPVAVEVNGRRGLEQLLAHAGREWTVLLTLESDRYVVGVAAGVGEFSGAREIAELGRIARTAVIHD